MKVALSKSQARNFLLQKQLLSPSRQFSGKDAVEQVFNKLRVIQYDPLNPCGRNVDLVLQARIADYHSGDYNRWLYEERKGIEVFDKELSIIPIEDLSLTTHNQEQGKNQIRIQNFFKEHQAEIEKLLLQLKLDGPLSSADILNKLKVDSGWGIDANWGRVALGILWRVGRVVIVKRQSGRKYYDLPEKIYPHLKDESYEEIAEEHVKRRINSVGILLKSGSGSGWLGMGSAKVAGQIIQDLITKKELIEIEVEGVRQIYVINAKDQDLLDRPDKVVPKMVFLAPLDNLIWDRNMIQNFFDFEYRWEVYVPAAKRKFGYYTLPILYGDQFVGRIEPVLKKGVLEIRGLWKEFKWDKNLEREYKSCLADFKKYLRAKEIIFR